MSAGCVRHTSKMRPNVLLVILDSVRAKNASVYGHYNETTPFLKEFAQRSTVYEQAHSPNIHSVASHASIFTGYHTLEHRLFEHESEIEDEHTIWEHLSQRHGYETGLFTPNPVLTQSSNLHECFDYTVGTDVQYPMSANSLAEESGKTYVNGITEWVTNQERPWAGCVNLIDAHYPYRSTRERALWETDGLKKLQQEIDQIGTEFYLGERPFWQLEALEKLYDEAIRELDYQVQRLVDSLKQQGQYEDTLIVITSDHGEAFGETSRVSPDTRLVSHSAGLHEVLTHVPLLVKFPGQTDPKTVDEVVSLAQFPHVVEQILNDDGHYGGFTDSETVTTYTERFKNPESTFGKDQFYHGDIEGPWLAYYCDTNPVMKCILHHGEVARIEVQDAQNSYRVGSGSEAVFEEIFDGYQNEYVAKGKENKLSLDAERRLKYLGYANY